jgi:hypothetical protein
MPAARVPRRISWFNRPVGSFEQVRVRCRPASKISIALANRPCNCLTTSAALAFALFSSRAAHNRLT